MRRYLVYFTIFFGSLILVMIIGLWAGRREETAEDFYLAGKDARWWGVAGSIFGSNVSANHIVGMMGVGVMGGAGDSTTTSLEDRLSEKGCGTFLGNASISCFSTF